MDKFTIEFYERENGDIPVEEFLLELDKKMRAKILGIMGILQERGNQLREPYSKHLEDGIFEIRGKVGTDISRVLYFFIMKERLYSQMDLSKKHRKPLSQKLIRQKYIEIII